MTNKVKMCKIGTDSTSIKTKTERKKQKEIERLKREKEKNISPGGPKAPEWERRDVYNAVKLFLIGIHLIVGIFIIKGRLSSAST